MSLHLIEVVEKTKQWTEYIRGKAQDATLLGQALVVAFVQLDELLLQVQARNRTYNLHLLILLNFASIVYIEARY